MKKKFLCFCEGCVRCSIVSEKTFMENASLARYLNNHHLGPFTNTCKGAGCKKTKNKQTNKQKNKNKNDISQKTSGPLLQTSKMSGSLPPFFFAMKITGQSHRKACKLNFTGNFVVILFHGPLYKGQNF